METKGSASSLLQKSLHLFLLVVVVLFVLASEDTRYRVHHCLFSYELLCRLADPVRAYKLTHL